MGVSVAIKCSVFFKKLIVTTSICATYLATYYYVCMDKITFWFLTHYLHWTGYEWSKKETAHLLRGRESFEKVGFLIDCVNVPYEICKFKKCFYIGSIY